MYTVRTMNAYTGGGPDLIWCGAAGNRTKATITGFGILDGFAGVLVRDDYGGYLTYDTTLAGVQQCLAHHYRYLDDAWATDPDSQAWTRQAGRACARHRPQSGPPGTPARPSWTPPSWPGYAAATTKPSPAGSRPACPGPGTRETTPG